MVAFSLRALTDTLNVSPSFSRSCTGDPIKDFPKTFQSISIDSRHIEANSIFVAIIGAKQNGHQYIEQAIQQGAKVIIASETQDLLLQKTDQSIAIFYVEETTLALGLLAKAWLKQFNIPLLAITGSSGKTTTRNLVVHICQQAFGEDKVLAPQGNYNNAWGVPLTLFRLTSNHKIAIIEMGMDHLGEIEYLSKLCTPDAALINNATPVHLAGLGSIENIAKAKGEIFSHLKANGSAIINADDKFSDYWISLLKASHKVIRFGLNKTADFRATDMNPRTNSFTLHARNKTEKITLQLQGEHNIKNSLAAAAIASTVSAITFQHICAGLMATQPFPGRLKEHLLENNIIVIDDAYNAAPASVKAAADCLKQYTGRRIFVLADMAELGEGEAMIHEEIGAYIKACGIEQLYTYGQLAKHATKGFGQGAQHFTDQATLCSVLKHECKANSVFLVKGSNAMKMQAVCKQLIAEGQEISS